jgi:predicted RNA methylase
VLPNKEEFLGHVRTLLEAPNGSQNRDVAVKMADILLQVTGISVDEDISMADDRVLDSGVAISPVKAAKCLLEVNRTQVFMKGIHEAIVDKAASKKIVHILYAGTGPYGTILLPLLPLLSEYNIKVQCLDIHQTNIDAVQKVAKWLEVDTDALAVTLADATQWRSEQQLFDIVISETMNTFLHREPQVRIFANLAQFLVPDGDLIPQKIQTSLEIQPFTTDGGTSFKQDLLVLDVTTSNQIREGDTSSFFHKLVLPESAKLYQRIDLNTDIRVYNKHVLGLNDCSLNLQKNKSAISCAPGQTIEFEYILNDDPFWQITVPNVFDEKTAYPIEHKSATGLCYLPRFWDKYRRMASNSQDSKIIASEFQLDIALAELVSLDFQTMMQKTIEFIDDVAKFEAWISSQTKELSETDIQKFNNECHHYSQS